MSLQQLYNTEEYRMIWVSFYNNPYRFYHNEDHIHTMFGYAASHNIELTDSQSLAILFHDAVYVPGHTECEEASVALIHPAIAYGYKYFSDAEIYEAQQIILDTKHHIPLNKSARVVCDLDLLGFAFSAEENAANIRAEFKYLPVEKWIDGRIRFLKTMRSRIPFFYTEEFKPYENLAYQNILERTITIRGNTKWAKKQLRSFAY